jgi:hypothetical protein
MDSVTDCCEYVSQISGSIKDGGFLKRILALQVGMLHGHSINNDEWSYNSMEKVTDTPFSSDLPELAGKKFLLWLK